jgi:hypothetical protein
LNLLLVPLAAEETAAPRAVTVSLKVPGEAVIALPAGWAWRIRSASPQWWTEEQWLPKLLAAPESTVTVRLFPAGKLITRLQLPPGGQRPAALELRFQTVPDAASRVSRTTIACPLNGERYQCSLPAAALDLRVKAEGFIPKYLWGVGVKPGAEHDLGKISLKRGASIVGWVQNQGTSAASKERKVELMPYIPGPQSLRAPLELRQAMARETVANERGFFQFERVLPGTYSVTASQPGAASGSVDSIQVFPDLEAEIREPLVLAPPVSAKVILNPPTDPYGLRWMVELRKKDAREPAKDLASPEGIWERRGLSPGLYYLIVTSGPGSRWVDQEMEITAGSSPLHIDIPVLRIRGRVTLGDEPLEATLWFGGQSGPRRVQFQSDEKGRFEGALPGEGTWSVDLSSAKERLRLALEPVEVKRPDGSAYARVDLRVPDTRLHGEVVDEDGHPLPAASIMVFHKTRMNSQFFADEKGEFEIRGFPAGRSRLEAHAGERTSGWVEVLVSETEETPRLRLVARAKAEIQGRIVSALRPVGGARLWALPELETGSMGTVEEAISRADGSFALSFPAEVRAISLLVHAPGFALRMLRTPVDPKTFLEVPVETPGGSLVVQPGRAPDDRENPARAAVLLHGGTWVRLEMLARRATDRPLRRPDGALEIPNLEPGDYLLCIGRSGQKLEELAGSSCAQGYLAPAQELVLTLPGPANEAGANRPESH